MFNILQTKQCFNLLALLIAPFVFVVLNIVEIYQEISLIQAIKSTLSSVVLIFVNYFIDLSRK